MNPRHARPVACLVAAVILCLSAGLGFAAAADKKSKTDAKDATATGGGGKIYRLKGEKKAKVAGVEMMTLQVEDVFNGKTETLYVPPNDPASKQYDPKTDIKDLIESLEPGAVIEVETEKDKGRQMATSVRKADAKPGEELPNGFVFVEQKSETKGGVENVAVVLSKFGREVTVAVPLVKDDEYENAKWEPDPKIDSVIRRLQSGTVVEVMIKQQQGKRPPTITEIVEYRPPERGKFVGLKEVELGGFPAAGFEITADDGTAISFVLDGMEQTRNGQTAFMPNPQQLAMVKRIKKDTPVEVRYRLEGRKWMLRDIRPLPASDKKAAKPAGKTKEPEAMKNGSDKSDKPDKPEKPTVQKD